MAADDAPVPSDVPDVDPVPYSSEERNWAMFCHLSALLAMWLGGFGFIGPLIIWLIKKDSSKYVDAHGKEALNFQLNLLGYVLICIPLVCVVIGIPLLIAVAIYGIIMPIVAGIKASGGQMYRYPFIIRLVS